MQNMYVGDIGDYGKYGLLRALFPSDYKLGIVWYLVPDENHLNDGKHTDYLSKSKFADCERDLFSILKDIISSGNRNISEIEQSNVFPDQTVFYSDYLSYQGINANSPAGRKKRLLVRDEWLDNALKTVQGCDAIFLDPDNGLETPSVSKYSTKAPKYTYYDEEKEGNTEATLKAASSLLKGLSDNEKQLLGRMHEIVSEYVSPVSIKPDSKAKALIRWIKDNLQHNDQWNGNRVIIFTEYVHTLRYLESLLTSRGMEEAILTIVGGMPSKKREEVNKAFQSPPHKHPVRILLATDAASEGADFQKYCNNLIHYEIPWNPVRMEQRNGRVDRHGQRSKKVFINHFVYRNHEDSEFLKRIVEKVETIRSDLGSVGAIIADNMRRHVLGEKVDLQEIDKSERRIIATNQMSITPQESDDIEFVIKTLNEARNELGITDQAQMDILKSAFKIEGDIDSIVLHDNDSFYLTNMPPAWSECRKYLSSDYHKRLLTFNRHKARDNDELTIVHLEHPLLKRSVATLRTQMWKSDNGSANNHLNRVLIETCPSLKDPIVIGWGRLVMLGPEHNRLHEGLVHSVATISNGNLLLLEKEVIKDVLNYERQPFNGDLGKVQQAVNPHLEALTDMLRDQGGQKAESLKEALITRGKADAKYASNLVIDRIKAIKKTISQWEERELGNQFYFSFDGDDEGLRQKETDIALLKQRIVELEVEKKQEPKRLEDLCKVKERRVYPVAVEILVPKEGF